MERMEFSMEKVCAPNAILVFQIPPKVRSKEVEYNKVQQYFLYAFDLGRYIQSKKELWCDIDQYLRGGPIENIRM